MHIASGILIQPLEHLGANPHTTEMKTAVLLTQDKP
jgi:hypothetical protein